MDHIKIILFRIPVIIALFYIVISALWIHFSDQFLLSVFSDPELLTHAQSNKGLMFVIISGVLIFFLVRKNNSYLGNAIDDLEKSRDKFEATFDQAPIGIVHHRPNEKWIHINQTLCDILGYKKDVLLQLDFEDFIHPDDLEKGRGLDLKLIRKKIERYNIDKRYKRKDGTYITVHITKSAVFNREDDVYLVATIEDITPQKEASNNLKKALKEKEILLAEIQHRVSNNLALVSALFELQSIYTENKQVHAILHASKTRIKCLSLIHETFADNIHSVKVNFSECLLQLVKLFEAPQSNLSIRKNIQSIRLNINQAIPVSLISNELLLIASREMTGQNNSPQLEISLWEKSGFITLKVSDNCGGIVHKKEFENPARLEYVLIKTLSSQVSGETKLHRESQQNSFELTFKKRNLRGPGNSMSSSINNY